MGDGVLQFDDPSLLRATWASDVLRGCGKLLTNSVGTQDTYALSSEADGIDVFISHNWAVGRARKFLALAVHFNLAFATSVALLAVALGGSLRYAAARRGPWSPDRDHVPFTCTLTVLAFSAALFFGHEAQAALGFRGKRVFLDKACIHQTDHELKQRGILSLGAFLRRSDSLVVCFTELYLRKLWTVYEFASFVLVHGQACSGSVHIIPTSLPVLGLASSLCFYLVGILLTHVVEAVGADPTALTAGRILVAYLGLWICVYIGRGWAMQQRAVRAIFQEFELRSTHCASATDRELVEANIILLMRHFSHVGVHASDQDALLAFDEYVRSASSRAFAASVGRLGVPYSFWWPIALTLFSEKMDTWCAAVARGSPGHTTAAQSVFNLVAHFVSSFATVPLVGALGVLLAKCCPSLRGVAEVAFCGGVTVLELLAIGLIDPTGGLLRPWTLDAAVASASSSTAFILSSAFLFALTACVYRQPTTWKVDAQGAPPAVGDAEPRVESARTSLRSEAHATVGSDVESGNLTPEASGEMQAHKSTMLATPSGRVVELRKGDL